MITVAIEGAPEGVVDSLVKEMAGSGPDIAACSTSGNTVDAEAVDTTNFENESAHEGEVEIDNATSLTGMQGTQEISMVVGEPFTTYIVGFGRNPFGRFSLTAAWNEQTGEIISVVMEFISAREIEYFIGTFMYAPVTFIILDITCNQYAISHTAHLNMTGRMRCEKKYITSKG